jgi:ribosomal protein S18 acetylase RimI-like enzyme
MRSTIRLATPADVPRIRTLVPGDQDLTIVPGRRYVLLLDAPEGQLAAAAGVTLENERGHLGFLAIAPEFSGEKLEDRMIAVAEALCAAFGCDTLDVPRNRRAA